MGKTFLGGTTQLPNIELLTPNQQNFLTSSLAPQQQQLASSAFSDFLQPYSPDVYKDVFQTSYIDPALQALQQQIIPAIKENFLGYDESGSGALNRALAQSATDVATSLGSQYGNFFNQQQANRMNALGLLGGLSGQRTFEPHFEQTQGILGPLLQGLGALGGGYLSGGGNILGNLISQASSAPTTNQRLAANKSFLSQFGY